MQTSHEQALAVRSEGESLVKFLASLTSDDWYRPTGIGEWQVRDIVVHLVDRAVGFYTETMARGLRGEVSEPPDFKIQVTGSEKARRKSIADRAIERRTDDMEPMVAGLADVINRFWKLQSELTLSDLDKPCWVRVGTVPVRVIGPIIISEYATTSNILMDDT